MTISDEDKKHIETFILELGWSAYHVFNYSESKGKNWKKATVYRLVNKIKKTGSSARKTGSGRPAYIRHNPTFIEEIVKRSQVNGPDTEKSSPRKIAKAMGISHGSVRHILADYSKESSVNGKRAKKSKSNKQCSGKSNRQHDCSTSHQQSSHAREAEADSNLS